MVPGASAGLAALFGRAPLIFLIGSLVLHGLSGPDSRIRNIAAMLIGRPAVEDRTAAMMRPAAIDEPGSKTEEMSGPAVTLNSKEQTS